MVSLPVHGLATMPCRYLAELGWLPASAVVQGRRNGSGRPGGCRTNNLTSKNFYVHIVSIFENVSLLLKGGRRKWREGEEDEEWRKK